MKVLGVIPARFQSSRFPGKPLALIKGKPLVQWVFESAKRVLPNVVVATDDKRIVQAVKRFGGDALLTSRSCQSGTDRVAEVARKKKAGLYLNIQGDEPLIKAETIKKLLLLHEDSRVLMGTVATGLSFASWKDPNVVKVLVDQNRNALYFSRAPLPFIRDKKKKSTQFIFKDYKGKIKSTDPCVFKHLGLYSYRGNFLKQYVRWSPTFLEKSEKLEQLRVLHYGASIRVALTPYDSIGVDVPRDIVHVERLLTGSRKPK